MKEYTIKLTEDELLTILLVFEKIVLRSEVGKANQIFVDLMIKFGRIHEEGL